MSYAINREDYHAGLALNENYSELFGVEKSDNSHEKMTLLTDMLNHFGSPISTCVKYAPDSDRGKIAQEEYRDAGFLTSLSNRELFTSTPWGKLLNLPTLAFSACIIVLVLGLQKPLFLIGLPLIAIANFLYVYKFTSKDVYLGRKGEKGKTSRASLVKPLTEKQRDLLHTTGKNISKAIAAKEPENNLPEFSDHKEGRDYMSSFQKAQTFLFIPDVPAGPEDKAVQLADNLKARLKNRLEDKETFSSYYLTSTITCDLSGDFTALKQIDEWMKSCSAKFEHPLTPGETEFNEKLITPEDFAELFKHVNNARYLKQRFLDYYCALFYMKEEYNTKHPVNERDQGALNLAKRQLEQIQSALNHIEENIFLPAQQILQYFDADTRMAYHKGEKYENILLLFHSKLLEIILLDKCARYYRDAPRTDTT